MKTKNLQYGLTRRGVRMAKAKISRAKLFLNSHYLVSKAGDKIPLIDCYKSPTINADRYVAEIQHRVYSMVEYAQDRGLETIFLTLTLPSAYHKMKTINGKLVYNPKYADGTDNYDDYTPKAGSKYLTKMLAKIRQDRSYKEIDPDDRCSFRVMEPHKNGTPHVHVAMFVPRYAVARLIDAIFRLFPFPQSDISSTYIPDEWQESFVWEKGKKKQVFKKNDGTKNFIRVQVQDSYSYMLKYIYKTLDDLRGDGKISELSYWYISNGITRFYTSRTLVSLSIYRPLNGRFTMLELTKLYRDKQLQVFLNESTKKPELMILGSDIIYDRQKYVLEEKEMSYDEVQKVSTVDDDDLSGKSFILEDHPDFDVEAYEEALRREREKDPQDYGDDFNPWQIVEENDEEDLLDFADDIFMSMFENDQDPELLF
ncbi:replication endonuclease [Sulfurovum lithotrophicum]|uniref:replication endonuclease n=1 Tax=Sulfurovum lithotrophicum TaxID=206403 RepID=UPI0014704E6F|nr:replication endonuclease [Sulfurovum lithotrophicum]